MSVDSRSGSIKLTQRQREVAQLACDGLTHNQIAKQLHIAQGTVKTHLSAMWQAFGVEKPDELTDEERKRLLRELVQPYLDGVNPPIIDNEPRHPPPTDPVEPINPPQPTSKPPVQMHPDPANRSRSVVFLVVGLIVGPLVLLSLLFAIGALRNPFQAADLPPVQPTVVPTSTSVVPTSEATQTPIVNTVTPAPSATPTAPPTATQVKATRVSRGTSTVNAFTDTFDTQIQPEWNYDPGQWAVVGGQLTALSGGGGFLSIGDATWRDYEVNVEVIKTGLYCEITVANHDGKRLAFFVGGNGELGWAKDGVGIPNTERNNFFSYPAQVRITLIANNGTGTVEASVNGQALEPIALAGYDRGSVRLRCPAGGVLDNFSVNPL